MSQLFADLGLMPELTRAVADTGYTQPTPVQVQAIPVILEGCDVLAGAQTGTGKTAGFTLPMLQRLMENPPEPGSCPVRALVVTPTRELAAQIEESVQEYGKYLPLRSTVVFGGVGMAPQVDALKAGVDILVATPGRLLDHANEQTVDLSLVEILVLDEADRMLDMGFIHDVKRILALLPAQRQNLLFSATFSEDIRALADGLLHKPVTIEVARRNAESELVAQRVHPTGQDRKRALLVHLIKGGDWKQVLVFTRTKHGANRLAHQLGRSGIAATAIHGNKGQGARTKALADFKAGLVRVLVATDLAARGLDIVELPHVVNYDLPQVAEDYVHRIGRTGRAGSAGEAISLVSPEEQPLLAEIEKLLGRRIDQTLIAGFEPGSLPPQHNRPAQGAQAQPGRQQARPAQSPQQPQNQQVEQNQLAQPASPAAEGGQRDGRGRRRGRGRNRQNGEQRGGEQRGLEQRSIEQRGMPREGGAAGVAPGAQAQQPREGNMKRAEANHASRNNQQARNEAAREDRDNRGNREIPNRNKRNVVIDDDFGNRIPPVKVNRSARARIAAGDIDEELDNIGNRMPPPPKNQRNLEDDEEEINFNVALPAPAALFDDDAEDTQQPMTNAGQLFPSSAGFMGELRVNRGNRHNGNGNGRNRGNKNNGRRGQPQQRQGQAQGQGQAPQRKQQRQAQKGPGRGHGQGQGPGSTNGRRQERRRTARAV